MILPICAYGDPILRETAREVKENSAELQQLIDDMLETMRGAQGAGLAAPQVGQSIKLFVVDLTEAWRALARSLRKRIPPQPMVCINPEIVDKSEESVEFGEGCLSIPSIVEDVRRPARVTLRYLDRDFRPQEIEGVSYTASVLQHEFDHLLGVLHIDHLSSTRRAAIQGTLQQIKVGLIRPDYPMAFGSGGGPVD